MTQHDAKRIEDAAFLMLHSVLAAGFGSEHAQACQKHFPPGAQNYSLRRARHLLEDTPVWTAIFKKE